MIFDWTDWDDDILRLNEGTITPPIAGVSDNWVIVLKYTTIATGEQSVYYAEGTALEDLVSEAIANLFGL